MLEEIGINASINRVLKFYKKLQEKEGEGVKLNKFMDLWTPNQKSKESRELKSKRFLLKSTDNRIRTYISCLISSYILPVEIHQLPFIF